MSRRNNVGSVPSADYDNYDYASHHANPSRLSNTSGRYSSLDAFCDEQQPDKEIFLGYGTDSVGESEGKHTAAIEALLADIGIEQKLMQEPVQDGESQAKTG